MAFTNREILEQNDLQVLHGYFEPGHALEKEDVVYPEMDKDVDDDLWSKAIYVTSNGIQSEYRSLYAEIKNSHLPDEEKKWWETILAILMKAPLHELEAYAKGTKIMPDQVSSECTEVAARILMEGPFKRAKERRRKLKEEEEKRLAKLRREEEEQRRAKEKAEFDLKMHRVGGNSQS